MERGKGREKWADREAELIEDRVGETETENRENRWIVIGEGGEKKKIKRSNYRGKENVARNGTGRRLDVSAKKRRRGNRKGERAIHTPYPTVACSSYYLHISNLVLPYT